MINRPYLRRNDLYRRWKDPTSTPRFDEQQIPLPSNVWPETRKIQRVPFAPFHFVLYNLSGPAFLTAYTKSKIYFYLIVCPADRTLIVRCFRQKNVDWVEFGTSVHSRPRIPSVQSVSSRRNMIQCIPAKIAK